MTEQNEKLPVSAGMLSWRAPLTVAHTIGQYGDFPQRMDEFRVFFQECSAADREVAERAHLPYEGRVDNVGIQRGMRWVVEGLRNDYVLYLENDFNLTCSPAEAARELARALDWIRSGRVDIVRLRSRFNPGWPCGDPEKYASVFAPKAVDSRFSYPVKFGSGNPWVRLFRPFKTMRVASRSAYVESNPEILFPRVFRKDETGLITTSAYLNWTNNPVLIPKDLFLRIADYADAHPSHRTVGGFQDFEKPLNCHWWRRQGFRIGLTDGIFTHNRIDR